MGLHFGPDHPDQTYVAHFYPERTIDLGEVVMNYAVAGREGAPALLLIPAQTESWWGYEAAMRLLEADFRVYAVDLRGQGRSTRTPGRYTLDNWGNDLVRFIQLAIGRPVVVSGLSSGGVLSAWLSAYAPPGLLRGALYEDPPLFSSEVNPAYGHSIRQGLGPLFALFAKYLGDQWSVGDVQGLMEASKTEVPAWIAGLLQGGGGGLPQNLKEYDPEWGRAFWTGTATAGCDHERLLKKVKVPVLLTHHFRQIDPESGQLMRALSDEQARHARNLIEAAGQTIEYQSFPKMGHFMHAEDPPLFASVLTEWAKKLR
jgi:pimeloyl-ACP methyl ester carboxylesterase